jgi:hypothetical protein
MGEEIGGNGEKSMENRMTPQDLEAAFQSMIPVLAKVPNVTKEMLAFNGSALDIDLFGYFFYEGIMPGIYSDSRKAALHILARVLCNDLGFEWSEDLLLTHRKSGIIVNLNEIRPDETKGIETDFGAIDECYDSVKQTIARRGLLPFKS